MKKLHITKCIFLPIVLLLLTFMFNSCTKDTDGSPELSAGNPVLGNILPVEGEGGTVVTITGTGLGDIRSIVFSNNNVPTGILPTLNTESSILFSVPDTAFGGSQNIILTNSAGKSLEVPFNVIALPVVNEIFPSDFKEGSTITLKGNNLDDVTNVIISGTSDQAQIVSKTRKMLVITMPASSVAKANLDITNLSGTSKTSQSFVNIAQSAQVFDDDLVNGFENWSWGGTFELSADYAITGSSSMKAAFEGGWGGMQLGNSGSIDITGCKTLAFWAKGVAEEQDYQVTVNWGEWQEFTVPANEWEYFTFDLTTAWPDAGNTVNNVTIQIKGEDKTVYFDNIVFVK